LANALTFKTETTQNKTQLNKPKQHNKHNEHKLTSIWSYSYDRQSGYEVAPFGDM